MRKADSPEATRHSPMREAIIPLDQLASGRKARIHDLRGGRGFISRLVTLGFTPGARVEMVQNMGRGPLIVLIRDTRIALGRRMARRILVTTSVGGSTARYG